jgi:hypothetical protein
MAITSTTTAAEIDNQLWALYIQYGLVNRQFTKGRLGLLTSAIATEIGNIIGILNGYANQFTLQTCTDPALIDSMIKPFVRKASAKSARVVLTFTRYSGYNESIRIPSGFAVSSSGNSQIVFKTAGDLYIWKGQQSANVVAYAVTPGSKYNVPAETLVYFSSSVWNSRMSVTNLGPAFGGMDEESTNTAKQRAGLFRYDRDGTLANLRSLLYMIGLSNQQYYLEQYGRGYGTVLIILDCDSDDEFADLCRQIDYAKIAGVKYHYVRSARTYLNFYVHLKTVGQTDYTETEKQNMYNIVQNTVQNIFAYSLAVGSDLSVNKLLTQINTQLASAYDIYSVNVSFDDGVSINKSNKIAVEKAERIYTNKIVTDITYAGS